MVHYAGIVRPNRAAGGLNFRFDQIIWVAWRRQRFMRASAVVCGECESLEEWTVDGFHDIRSQ